MRIIRRNTDLENGPADGVAADIQCAVTQYAPGETEGGRTVTGQDTMPCTVYCS